MKFYLSVPIWGHDYIEQFANIGLKSLLTPKNLFALPQDSKFVFHVKHEEVDYLNSFNTVKILRNYLDVVYRPLLDKGNKYATMNACHREVVEQALTDNVSILFLPPDIIWPCSTFSAVIDIAEKGTRVIHCPGIRLNRETILPELNQDKYYTTQELATLGMKHLHEIVHMHMWKVQDGNVGETFYPSHIYWRVEQGLLVHGFHLHPLMVYPTAKSDFYGTLDDDLALRLVPDFNQHYVVRNSNELMLWEIDGPGNSFAHIWRKESIHWTRQWASMHANSIHRKLVTFPIRVGEASDLAWEKAEQEASQIVNQLL